jgi:hypothetical protein
VVAVRSIGDPEGGPPGYAIGYLHGEDLAFTYRSVEDDGPVVLVTHPREALFATAPAHVITGLDRFRVRTWSQSPVAEVRGRLDGGQWFELDPYAAGAWEAPLQGDRLTKGEHIFEVEVVCENARRGSQRTSFAVDPTGRYTAVPSTRPRVMQTSFC